jgi:outer membrane protein OmpA-like peptidoglycan-associated protein
MTRHVLLAAAVVAATACAAGTVPPALEQARTIHAGLVQRGADRRTEIEGSVLRAREAIRTADVALEDGRNRDYVAALSDIALNTARTAEALEATMNARAAADSARTARLNRLLAMSQSQRDALAAANQLSQQEIAALRERNVVVTQQADSLRAEAEAANARLNEALTQLRSLVVEITNLQQTARGLVISLSDILFDVDKATLKPGAQANLNRIAAVLKQYPNHDIAVEGHTDSTASEAYNQRLSEERAASVRTALIAGGVDAAKISARGFGESQPVADNGTSSGRQQNRRVEVIVLGAGTVADALNPSPAAAPAPAQAPPATAPTTPPTDTTRTRPDSAGAGRPPR